MQEVKKLTGWLLVSVPIVAVADHHYGALGRFLGLLLMFGGIAWILKWFCFESKPESEPESQLGSYFYLEPDSQSELEPDSQPELEPDSQPELEAGSQSELEPDSQLEPELNFQPETFLNEQQRRKEVFEKMIDEILQREDIPEDKGFCIPFPNGKIGYTSKRLLRLFQNQKQNSIFGSQKPFESLDPKED